MAPNNRNHLNAGNVRAESFSRPMQHLPNNVDVLGGGAQESRQQDLYGPDCTPDPTLGEAALQETEETLAIGEDDEEDLLQRIATRHYYR